MQVDDVVRQVFARFVNHGKLATGAHAGVDAQNGNGPRRRREEQVMQVVSKYLNRFAVRAQLDLQANFSLYRRIQQAFPRVFNGELELRRPIAGCAQNTRFQEGDRTNGTQFDVEIE